MPLYEYQCSTCGAIEEAIQKFSDPPLTACRRCSGQLSRLISQSSFHLKGTGWYVTDYSKKKPSAGQSKAEESAASPAKPAAKDDSASATVKSDA
jgi:putative FmdB family regulatory protein